MIKFKLEECTGLVISKRGIFFIQDGKHVPFKMLRERAITLVRHCLFGLNKKERIKLGFDRVKNAMEKKRAEEEKKWRDELNRKCPPAW